MEFGDIVGFLVALLILALPIIRKMAEEKWQKDNPEEHAKRKQEAKQQYRQMLKSMDMDYDELLEEEEEEQPAPPSLPQEKVKPAPSPAPVPTIRKADVVRKVVKPSFNFSSKVAQRHSKNRIEGRHVHSKIEDRSYKFGKGLSNPGINVEQYRIQKKKPSKGRVLLDSLGSKKDLLIAHEIIAKPLGLRKSDQEF